MASESLVNSGFIVNQIKHIPEEFDVYSAYQKVRTIARLNLAINISLSQIQKRLIALQNKLEKMS
jgi:hypothetical protein